MTTKKIDAVLVGEEAAATKKRIDVALVGERGAGKLLFQRSLYYYSIYIRIDLQIIEINDYLFYIKTFTPEQLNQVDWSMFDLIIYLFDQRKDNFNNMQSTILRNQKVKSILLVNAHLLTLTLLPTSTKKPTGKEITELMTLNFDNCYIIDMDVHLPPEDAITPFLDFVNNEKNI